MQGSLLDANVWVAFAITGHQFHPVALKKIQEATARSPAVFCLQTELTTLRLLTTRSVHQASCLDGLSNIEAISMLTEWFKKDGIQIAAKEPEGLRECWLKLSALQTTSPRIWMDAYLAAFAICGDLRFVTLDKGSRRYEKDGLNLELLSG